jgi:hypothetical protein
MIARSYIATTEEFAVSICGDFVAKVGRDGGKHCKNTGSEGVVVKGRGR